MNIFTSVYSFFFLTHDFVSFVDVFEYINKIDYVKKEDDKEQLKMKLTMTLYPRSFSQLHALVLTEKWKVSTE